MKKIIPTLALILTTGIAYAEQVYLNCNIPELLSEDYRNFSVTLDEATGKVSQTYEKHPESSFNADAIYSVNSISYKRDVNRSTPFPSQSTYIIDRATLSIKQSNKVSYEGLEETKTFLSPGQCIKAETVKGNKI